MSNNRINSVWRFRCAPLRAGYTERSPTLKAERVAVPEISRFYGIIIAMFFDDHNPPHFHARYGKAKVAIEINSLRILEGKFPPRALGLVIEWASQHKEDLLHVWGLAKNKQPLQKIEPLK